MSFEEQAVQHILPELYQKVSGLQQAVDHLKADIDAIRDSLASLQNAVTDLTKISFELKGRYEGMKNEVKLELLTEIQKNIIKQLKSSQQ